MKNGGWLIESLNIVTTKELEYFVIFTKSMTIYELII